MRIRRLRLLLIRLGILTITLLAGLFVAELVCAIVAPSEMVTMDILGRTMRTARAKSTTFHVDEQEYWDLSPSQQGRTRIVNHEYEWRINSDGFRNDEFSTNAGQKFRVLCLGDSQTFGTCADQEQTFPAQLERLLSAKATKAIQVVNGGVPGYGTFEPLWKLKRVVEE